MELQQDWGAFTFTPCFPGGSDGKESACSAEGQGSIPGLGRSPGEGNGEPLQYPYLENPMDGGAWSASVHRMANSRIWLSDFTLCMYVYQLEYQNHQLVVCEWGFITETG